MDVTCDKCGAEYEFDETLLGDKGATVKCSSCNHVFRVLGKKEPGRPALKLRFAKSGRVESLSSLRELQLRVRNGEVSADDLLGRDGFEFRRLGDVPELKNFFSRAASPPGAQRPDPSGRHAQVNETSMPPAKNNPQPGPSHDKASAKRTMLGVGPLNPQIPGPPRVPSIPGALPPPSGRPVAPAQSPRVAPAPISSIPTNPNAQQPLGGTPTSPAGYEPRRAPVSQAPTTQGSVPQASPNYASEAPVIGRPLGNTPRTVERGPASGGPAPVKLYLSEDEAPPARATAGGSKIWLYAGFAVVLGGAGFVGVNMLGPSPKGAEPNPPAAARVEAPQPAPAVAPEAEPTAPVAPAPGEPPKATAKAETPKAEPTPAPAAPPAREAAPAAAEPEKRRNTESRTASASSSKDPTDYGGWVSRGDQLTSRGDLAGARQAYESALALRATGSEAHSGLGFALLAEGRARDALSHFDRAASSGYAEANIGLGDAYRKLGQKSSAVEAYQTYLERLPSGSKANYARTQIENLKGGASTRSEGPREPAGGVEEYRPAGEMNAPSAEPSDESAP